MSAFILRRVALIVPTFLGVTLLAFALIHLIPGDPVENLSGERGMDPARRERLLHEFGLDRSLPRQYAEYIGQVLRGDLGTSLTTHEPVMAEFRTLFPATVELAFFALLFALCLGLPAGIVAALKRNTVADYAVMGVSLTGYSMPIFWWALLLILFFSVDLGWTPVSGRIAVQYDVAATTGFMLIDTLRAGDWPAFRSAVSHLVLPSIVLGTIPLAVIARMTRSSMLEVLREDYVRTARAKGLPYWEVVLVHALRNALVPVITVIGLQVGLLLSGAILTETIFSWPGVGNWLVHGVQSRDYPVVQGGILLVATIVISVNLIVDLLYGVINPRIGMRDVAAPALTGPPRAAGRLREFWRSYAQSRGAVIGLMLVVILIALALGADVIAPYPPNEQYRDFTLTPPLWDAGGSAKFILGTDPVGRDMLSRLLHGTRLSLLIGAISVAISLSLGILLGMLAGYLRGLAETFIMRLMDVMLALPSLLLAIAVVAILGPGLVNAMYAIAIVLLPHYVRLARAAVIAEAGKEYVASSRIAGAGPLRLMFSTILPNCTAPLIVQATLGFSTAILDAAALGFLGLGAQPPTPEWGAMLAGALEFIQRASWVVTLPGLAILVTVLAFNLMGDGLRDALDPKLRR